MKKRFTSFMLFFALSLTFCTATASASDVTPYASKILGICTVGAGSGNNPGELKINYEVRSDVTADSIGVASIKIYKSDGTYVTTISGTPSNGLIRYMTDWHKGTYTYTGASGASYYAEVTVAAAAGSLYDSRTITTNTVKAP